jgi:hypothetical protein
MSLHISDYEFPSLHVCLCMNAVISLEYKVVVPYGRIDGE